jgi:hypothetical protein
VTLLLDAGKADRTIRPDVDARDVILLVGYLTRLEQDEWDARARHLLQVVLDGLRQAPGTRETGTERPGGMRKHVSSRRRERT